jgi:hypothetical protein
MIEADVHPFKYRSPVCCGVVALFIAATPAAAQNCPASAGIKARLDRLNQFTASPGYSFQIGDAYLDANCFADAKQWLLKAKAEAEAEPESNEPARGARRTTIEGCLALLDARERWARGDSSGAKSELIGLVRTYTQERVRVRSVITLAELIEGHPDPAAWQQIQPVLEGFLERPFLVWSASRALVNHFVLTQDVPSAIDYLRKIQSRPLSVQVSLQLKIRLGQCLNLAGRSAEARILVSSLEKEVGEELLDPNARVDFLRLGADVWRKRANTAPDPDAAQKAGVYESALKEAERQL